MNKIDRLRDSQESIDGRSGVSIVRNADLKDLFAERDRLEAHIKKSFALFSEEAVPALPPASPQPCVLNRLMALPEKDMEFMCRAAYEAGYRGLDTSILFEVLEGSGYFIGEAAEYQSGNTRKDLDWFKAKVDGWISVNQPGGI